MLRKTLIIELGSVVGERVLIGSLIGGSSYPRVPSGQGKPGKPGKGSVFRKSQGKPGKVREFL